MRQIVDDGRQEHDKDGLLRQRKATVGGGVIRLADGHVSVSGDQDRESDGGRLTDENERIRVETNVVPRHRTVDPLASTGKPDDIIDREVNQPDGEKEIVGDGERLEQKNGDGRRFSSTSTQPPTLSGRGTVTADAFVSSPITRIDRKLPTRPNRQISPAPTVLMANDSVALHRRCACSDDDDDDDDDDHDAGIGPRGQAILALALALTMTH